MNRGIDMPANIHPRRRSWKLCGIIGIMFLMPPIRSFCAQTITPDPDPGIRGEGFVDYVGNYGEVFKLRGGWQIQASMHDGVEVINHFPSSRISFSDSVEPFNPKPSDFVPENFTRYALIQLLILPRTPDSHQSLEELKALKIKDLLSSHVGFQVLDHPNFGGLYGDWPKGTFEIWISTPYRLSQLYTASDSYLCILTSGRDTPPSTVISSQYDWMRSGVRDWVAPPTQLYKLLEPHPLTLRQTWEQGMSLHILAKPGVWITWTLVSGISCLLTGFLGMKLRWERLRRASLFWLIFSNAGALLGGSLGLVFWPFAWPAQHLPIPAAVACLFMPLLVLFARRFRGACARRSALIGVAAWAVIAAGILSYLGLAMEWGTDFIPVVPVDTAIVTFICYGVGGIIFGLFDLPLNENAGTQALIALAFISLMSPIARAQSDSVPIRKATPNLIDGGIDFNARANLAARGITTDNLKKDARKSLIKTRTLYTYQRVEIKGIWVKEDTNDELPDMFDKQVEPSHLGDINSAPLHMPAWIKDLQDLHKDAKQSITQAAMQTVKDLQGQEVNEIVAHSWGTEIVYNAILAGAIKPPRRLIVAGMPDRDFEKWKALSKYTGTEVVVYSDSHDPAALAARLLGDIRDGLSKAGLAQSGSVEDVVIRNPGQFEQQWEKACQVMVCNPHDRKPSPPSYHPAYKGISHSRLEYYQAMMKDGVLPKNGDVKILQANQDALINAEASRIFESQLAKERQNIIVAMKKAQDAFEAQRRAMKNAPTLAPLPAPLPLAPSSVSPAPADPYWQARALYNLSWKACQPGAALTQEDFDALGVFPTGGDIPGTAKFESGLSGCWKSVFDRALAANRPGGQLTGPLLSQWAAETQPRQPPPYHHRDPDDAPQPHPIQHCVPQNPATPDVPGSCEEGYHQ